MRTIGPAGVGRNTGRGFRSASFDVRVSRRLRPGRSWTFDLMADAFNLLNRTNLQIPNNIFGPGRETLPTFGQSTAAADPRQLQFGARLGF